MADEKNNMEESGEQQEKPVAVKKRSPLPMIIGAVVVLLVLGGGGFFLFNYMNSAKASETPEEAAEPVDITETNIYYSEFETNVVNLASSEEYAYMYLKYGFDLELSNEELAGELVMKKPRIAAIAAGVMSNRDWSEICEQQGRERLAREALRAINDELTGGEVIGLYFSTFVAQ